MWMRVKKVKDDCQVLIQTPEGDISDTGNKGGQLNTVHKMISLIWK